MRADEFMLSRWGEKADTLETLTFKKEAEDDGVLKERGCGQRFIF